MEITKLRADINENENRKKKQRKSMKQKACSLGKKINL